MGPGPGPPPPGRISGDGGISNGRPHDRHLDRDRRDDIEKGRREGKDGAGKDLREGVDTKGGISLRRGASLSPGQREHTHAHRQRSSERHHHSGGQGNYHPAGESRHHRSKSRDAIGIVSGSNGGTGGALLHEDSRAAAVPAMVNDGGNSSALPLMMPPMSPMSPMTDEDEGTAGIGTAIGTTQGDMIHRGVSDRNLDRSDRDRDRDRIPRRGSTPEPGEVLPGSSPAPKRPVRTVIQPDVAPTLALPKEVTMSSPKEPAERKSAANKFSMEPPKQLEGKKEEAVGIKLPSSAAATAAAATNKRAIPGLGPSRPVPSSPFLNSPPGAAAAGAEKPSGPSVLTADEIVDGINAADKELESLEADLVELELELQRHRAAEPRVRRAVDKVQALSPAMPEVDEGDESDEPLSSDSEPDEQKLDAESTKEPVKRRRGRPPKNSKKQVTAGNGDVCNGKDGDFEASIDLDEDLPIVIELPPARKKLLSRLGCLVSMASSDDVCASILGQSKDLAAAARGQFNSLIPDRLLAPSNAESRIEEPSARGAVTVLNELLAVPVLRTPAPPGIQATLRREFADTLRSHVLAAIRYKERYEKWRRKELHRLEAAREAANNAGGGGGTSAFRRTASVLSGGGAGGSIPGDQPQSPVLGRSSSRGRSGDIVRSDLEERQAIATLQVIDLIKKMVEVRETSLMRQLINIRLLF